MNDDDLITLILLEEDEEWLLPQKLLQRSEIHVISKDEGLINATAKLYLKEIVPK